MNTWAKRSLITVVVVVILGFVGFFTFSKNVSTGNAGLVINMSGGLEDKVLGQGRKPVAPWKRVVEYPISTETVYLDGSDGSGAFPTTTNEGKQIPVDARYSYHMDVKSLPDVYRKFRGASNKAIENGWIKTELQKTVRSVTSQYSVFDLNGAKVSEINKKVFEQLATDLEKDGIILEDFSIGAIHPDEKTLASLQSNVEAQLALQGLEYQKQQKVIEAESKRIEAQGNADKALIEAQGQAKANQALQQSITDELIQMEIAKNWNGILPQVTGGSTPMIQLPAATTEKK
jgi:regulator of protease activity HflC (stomatin/prohibitin superfamily)